MRKILTSLQVLQMRKIDGKRRVRINPYNPLSYITVPLLFLMALLLFGVVGMWQEMDGKNPFKWH